MRLPFTSRFSVTRFATLSVVRMSRVYFGRELPPVHCYAAGDTLVDTGVASQGEALARLVRDAGIRRALITHHHEDHAGNADRLAQDGLDVLAGEQTAVLLGRDLPIRFYQHVLWGKAHPARVALLRDDAGLHIGGHRADIVPAPGHCVDQVAFHVPEEGWLFSGDAFVHERTKVFRRDEDFAATTATLERFLTLDFDVLLCAHRPRFSKGKEAIREKLAWLRDIEGKVRALHREGVPTREIARRTVPGARPLTAITLGDASAHNMVRSILHGPEPRPEVTAALRRPERP